MNEKQLLNSLQSVALARFGADFEDLSHRQIYECIIYYLNQTLSAKKAETDKKFGGKKVFYMSMEFLVGRSLKNNLFNLQLEAPLKNILKSMNVNISDIYELEPDAGLGNGGLGRLASCYLDSLTTLGSRATGYSICYEFGTFKQVILDGWQTEFPDNWLEMGGAWLVARPDEAKEVLFDGYIEENWLDSGLVIKHKDATRVVAVPYDLFISGYNSERVNVLRLWGARTKDSFDIQSFSRGDYLKSMEKRAMAEAISKVLYPADEYYEGKLLRLSQQYFFVCASLTDIVTQHLKEFGTLDNFAEKNAIHINDTHPALCVPELMRIFIDECSLDWDKAWEITTNSLYYTNHTVMAEALEKWDIDLFKKRLPRIYAIVEEINKRFCNDIFSRLGTFSGGCPDIEKLSIIGEGKVRMANMAIIGSRFVNGVSAMHSEIIKKNTFRDFNIVFPEKFTNVTNGITHRRWLCQSNEQLTAYLNELLKADLALEIHDLEKLTEYSSDIKVLNKLFEIKQGNKKRLAAYIKRANGINVNVDSIFDVQVKRLHEYKRQLLCALYILHLYLQIKKGKTDIYPRTFIFGAKASPSYFMAKEIINFICSLADLINQDHDANSILNVVFIQDYKVSLAELIIPAANISEQISLAGKEASGTGNMKFMMNGAVTIGTLDGANVEISEQAGKDNIFLFGLKEDEVAQLFKSGYDPKNYTGASPDLLEAINFIRSGGLKKDFTRITEYLENRDPYMICADFESYKNAQQKIDEAYRNKHEFFKKALINIAKSSIFASDRSIGEYEQNIWNKD